MTPAPDTAPDGFRALRELCQGARQRLSGEAEPVSAHPRLDRLVQAFGLSPFERDIVLLAAGIEVDDQLAPLLSRFDPGRAPVLSFAQPLGRLASAHWSALSPDAPLRRWQLVTLAATRPLARAEIVIDERILHHLAGIDPIDARLAAHLLPVPPADWLPAALMREAARAAETPEREPLIEIESDDPRDARAVAAAAAARASRALWRVRGADLAVTPLERHGFATLWAREVALADRALLIGSEAPAAAIATIADGPGMLFLHGAAPEAAGHRPRLRLHLAAIAPAEQDQIRRIRLGRRAASLNGALDAVTRHFTLGFSDVIEAADTAAPALDSGPDTAADTLWNAARAVGRPQLGDLATEIDVRAGWGDLVLPDRELWTLRAIAAQVRQRQTVYGDWGFGPPGSRGIGIAALFSGPSGSGKTLAAEVLAHDLRLHLFRIDLSRVVSKYIGETEKNLGAVFDAAENGGAILLFDEADALFGKRSEVRDSHDRYANMEVAYLLQRIESFRGLAILTTNFRAALDKAFARRLRFIVEFPFPGYDERLRIWQRAFPDGAALDGVDPARLARLNVAGGAIRNIALNAAFLAADAGKPIGMRHLAVAAEAECMKLEKKITEAEMRGWS